LIDKTVGQKEHISSSSMFIMIIGYQENCE